MTETWQAGDSETWGRASGPRAGFWRRLGAFIVDGLVVGVIGGVLGLIIRHGSGDYIGAVIGAIYYTAFEGGRRGAGLGKQALGIRVIDANTGQPIGYPRAFVRWITAILSFVCILLGYLWMLWDSEKQCWHDKFAGDVVVPTADYPVLSASGSSV